MQYTHVFELGQNVPQSVWSAAEITSIAVLADDPHIQHLCDARRVRERPLLGADHGAVSLEAGQVLEVMRPVPLLSQHATPTYAISLRPHELN